MQRPILSILILLASVAAIVGAGLGGDGVWLHYLGKPLATLLILWWAASTAEAVSPRYRRLIVIGMILSLIGDVLLMLPGDWFVPGLIAFLLAHCAYIAAFAPDSTMPTRAKALLLSGLVATASLAGLLPRIGTDLRIPVLVYGVVLATMVAMALARAWTPALVATTPRSVRFAAAGGVCFVISDSLLAWDKFAGVVPWPALLVLSTYWFAQWCIARSVRRA